MLRRVRGTHVFTCSGTGATAVLSVNVLIGARDGCDRECCLTLMHRSAEVGTTWTTAMVKCQRRLFTTGSPGKDLLRHFVPASRFSAVVSPLESLRPPAPPSASDAQPFGSLNRTNSMRRYVNANTVGTVTSTAGSEEDSASSSASSASESRAGTAPSPRRMELCRLLRRHHGTSPNFAASPASSHNVLYNTRAEEDPPKMQQKARNPTVAKAQTVIATAAAAAAKRQANTPASSAVPNASRTLCETANGATGSTLHRSKGAGARVSDGFSASSGGSGMRHQSQVYKEHCTIGWSPEDFYGVVADVKNYPAFLPWCAGSEIHSTRRVRVPPYERHLSPSSTAIAAASRLTSGGNAVEEGLVDAIEMIATLTIGFAFLKEKYTSRVMLYPCNKIVATLYDEGEAGGEAALGSTNRVSAAMNGSSSDKVSTTWADNSGGLVVSFLKKAASTAGTVAKRSILQHLRCEWEFVPVEGRPSTVEVLFVVSFEFKNPLHSHMIMSNLVTLMTRSFERRCETLYGPPSGAKETLPVLS